MDIDSTEYEDLKGHIQKLQEQIQLIREMVEEGSNEELMDIYGAAEYLGYKVSTLHTLISRDEIPSHKDRGKRFFKKSELIDWRCS